MAKSQVIALCAILGLVGLLIYISTLPGAYVEPSLVADLAAQKDCCEASVSTAKKARPFPARRQGLTLQQGETKYGALKGATSGLVVSFRQV